MNKDTQATVPVFIDHSNPPREGKKIVERDTVQCIVKHPTEEKYLGLKWKNYDWQTFIIGGVEKGEDAVEAGKREIFEETGFKNPVFVRQLGGIVQSHYFANHKDENRIANVKGLLFELKDLDRAEIDPEEAAKHDALWIPKEEMPAFVRGAEVHELWDRLIKGA
jgi:8-oxo-dGTP pyrophosphatase MutT (NUDIX family)